MNKLWTSSATHTTVTTNWMVARTEAAHIYDDEDWAGDDDDGAGACTGTAGTAGTAGTGGDADDDTAGVGAAAARSNRRWSANTASNFTLSAATRAAWA